MTQPSFGEMFPAVERVEMAPAKRKSRVELLAEVFRAFPGEWFDGMALAAVAGQYAWRTRVSDLRHPPFNMTIEQRERRRADGSKISEYRHVPDGPATGGEA